MFLTLILLWMACGILSNAIMYGWLHEKINGDTTLLRVAEPSVVSMIVMLIVDMFVGAIGLVLTYTFIAYDRGSWKDVFKTKPWFGAILVMFKGA